MAVTETHSLFHTWSQTHIRTATGQSYTRFPSTKPLCLFRWSEMHSDHVQHRCTVNANAPTMHIQDCAQRNSPVRPAARQTKASCQPNAAHSGLLMELLKLLECAGCERREGLFASLLEPSAWLLLHGQLDE